MKFQIGCNYWASHAGTEMWNRWDEEIVKNDLELLSKKVGVKCIRMFPIWREFQPIHACLAQGGELREYLFPHDAPLPNPEGLDPVQLEHFHTFCRLAEKNGIKLIVGLVTGWMSGRLFVPPALEGKSVLTDPECLMWENRYVRGMVREFRDEKAILAWDLGNECNCMGKVDDPNKAYVWTMTISNAIRMNDPTRPVISGMHGLTPEGVWNYKQQGELTDILTPHPYPSVFSKRDTEPLNQLTTTLYPTAQILLYSGLGGRQAMIEETGTFSKMLGKDELAADYLRLGLWSGLANGAAGTLWWCAFDQEKLEFPPYEWNMCENELGLVHSDLTLKEAGKTMAAFSHLFDQYHLEDLPARQVDACCVLTRNQNQLLVNYTATVMAKLAGFETDFIYQDQPLPDARLYLLPSVASPSAITVTKFREILRKVADGATLYVSLDDGLLLGFDETFGAQVLTRQNRRGPVRAQVETPNGVMDFTVTAGMELWLDPTTAQVLGKDENGRPIFLKNKYGKGEIYLLVAPLEKMLADRPGSFCDEGMPPYQDIYRAFSQNIRAQKIAVSQVPQVVITQHMRNENEALLVAINYTAQDLPLKMDVQAGWTVEKLCGAENDLVLHDNGAVLLARRTK